MKKVKINTRNGFTLLEILLALTIVGVIAAFTIGISYSIRNMTKVNSTKSRMEQIAAKAKQYYRGHGSLPTAGGTPADSVPVGASDLNMEQKFRLDAWGQYYYYYMAATINGVTVDGKAVAGYIVSYGPDQNLDSPGGAGPVTTSNDDIVLPIDVSQDAVEIALEELKVLQSKVKAFDALYEGIDNGGATSNPDDDSCIRAEIPSALTTCPPISGLDNDPNCGTATLDEIDDTWTSYACNSTGYSPENALGLIIGYYSLATGYQTDPWGHAYVWGRDGLGLVIGTIDQSDPRYHKFFSQGPDNTVDADDIIP